MRQMGLLHREISDIRMGINAVKSGLTVGAFHTQTCKFIGVWFTSIFFN